MIKVFAKIFGAVMSVFYSLFKLKKTENKISFISRQSETPSCDFRLLINEIKRDYPEYKVVTLCKMIPDGFSGKVKYIPEMFRQMRAMATSKVVVLDGYCILASMLKHKKELKIIQLWHALGAFKKFGRSILDMEGGKSSAVANAFKMHKNYDLIAASGDKCVPYLSQAFGQDESKFVPIGIPRMDYLTSKEDNERIRENIFNRYPELKNNKKNILYVPTFRDTPEDREALKEAAAELVKRVNYSEFNLIVRHHVVDTNKEEIYVDSHTNKTVGEHFSCMDFMAAADVVITDYSSAIYEAILKDIPLYIYCFDSDKYIKERGFYIDFYHDIPAVYSKNALDLCTLINAGEKADEGKVDAFKKAYVNKKYDSISAVWAKIIDELAKGVYDGRYNYNEQT